MFRETLQTLVCLSVLVGTSSLHMVRDSYHRPLSDVNTINHDTITDPKIIPEPDLSMRATRKPIINNGLTYYDLFPSLSSSLSSSSSLNSVAESNSAIASAIDTNALRTPSITTTKNGNFRGTMHHHIAHSSNRLPNDDDISTVFEPYSWLSNRVHGFGKNFRNFLRSFHLRGFLSSFFIFELIRFRFFILIYF